VIVSGSLVPQEQVKHLDARAGRLDTAGDRPRDTNRPARRAPARPDALCTGVPGGAWPPVGA
jgi:hypothetical protein